MLKPRVIKRASNIFADVQQKILRTWSYQQDQQMLADEDQNEVDEGPSSMENQEGGIDELLDDMGDDPFRDLLPGSGSTWQLFTDAQATEKAAGDEVSVAADSAYYTMSHD
jgi:hypothetical protein